MTGYERERAALIRRLHCVEGQVRGIERMVEENRDCVDVLTQVAAARTALERVGERVLEGHVEQWVANAIASCDTCTGNARAAELLAAVQRFARAG